MDLKRLIRDYGVFLVDEYEPGLTENSAAKYKTYIRALQRAFDTENGKGSFESVLAGSGELTFFDLSKFVTRKLDEAGDRQEKKPWSDRQSALHRLEDFLDTESAAPAEAQESAAPAPAAASAEDFFCPLPADFEDAAVVDPDNEAVQA